MTFPLPFRKRRARDEARQDWIDERLREARMVVADVVHHSDHLLRMACNVLVQHGQTPAEREDARILLVVLDARSPQRAGRHRPDRSERSDTEDQR
jgi:hypothetical protein